MTDRTIFKAISQVQGELALKGIDKTQVNTYDKYKFRGIDDVLNALAPLLAKHGLIIIPKVTNREIRQVQTSQGKNTNHAVVTVDYLLCDTHGDAVNGTFVGEAMDRGDKALNKALTAAYKYFLFETFCIPVKGTDDADSESHEVDDALTDEQTEELLGLCVQTNTDVAKYQEWLGVESLASIPASRYASVKQQLTAKLNKMAREYAAEVDATNQSLEGERQ